MPETAEKLRHIERGLLAELHGVDFIRNGAPDGIPGNMSLSFRGAEGEMLLHRLDLMGICVSTGSACDSARTQISHVLEAMGGYRSARGTPRRTVSLSGRRYGK